MNMRKIALIAGLAAAGGAAAFGLARVPLLKDPDPPQVPLLDQADDGLLDVRSASGQDDLLPAGRGAREKDGSGGRVPRLNAADDDLLDVESRAGQDGLLEPYPATRPAADGRGAASRTGEAGATIASPSINASFAFDLAVGYVVHSPEAGLVNSYYLLDPDGNIGLDPGALKGMAGGVPGGDGNTVDFQVLTNAADHYTYMTSADMGRIAMSVNSGQTASGREHEAMLDARRFARTMKPTGQVRDIGRNLSNQPYRSTEYAGIEPDTGQPVRLWLARPDFRTRFGAATYMGLGIVTLPGEGQRLVTRMEGGGVVMELSYISRRSQRFSGAGYRDISSMMNAYGRGATGP